MKKYLITILLLAVMIGMIPARTYATDLNKNEITDGELELDIDVSKDIESYSNNLNENTDFIDNDEDYNENVHEWNDGTVISEATCYKTGQIEYECNLCGITKIEEIPKLMHQYGTSKSCMVCGERNPEVDSPSVSGVDGDIEWKLYEDGLLIISGAGDYEGTPDWLKYNEYYEIKRATVNVSDITSTSKMFYNLKGLTSVNFNNFDTSNVIDMSNMFYNCWYLTSVDVSNLDTGNVTNMSHMFSECVRLSSVNVGKWNTGKVTDMSYMFSNCEKLTSVDVSNFDTGNVTNMSFMFSECYALTNLNLENFDTSNVIYMNRIFYNCQKLQKLNVSNFNTNNVTDMCEMFYQCYALSSLDLSGWDTGNVTDMDGMFQSCRNLAYLDVSGWNTGSVTSMSAMFSGCNNLMTLDTCDWDTNKVMYMNRMFASCSKLSNVITISNKVSKYDMMFYGAATSTDAIIYVCFGGNCSESLVKNIINTKSDSSHVYLHGANNHIWDGGTNVVESTCYSEGEIIYKCNICNVTKKEKTTVKEHNYDDKDICIVCGAKKSMISIQPMDYVGYVGDMASFSVVPIMSDLKYQWFFSSDGGTNWAKSSGNGNQTNTLEIEFKAYKAGQLFRCEITDINGNTEVTDSVKLMLKEVELVITKQPEDYVGSVSDEVEFIIQAEGNGLNYQWYLSSDGGETWAKSYTLGYNTNTLNPVLREFRDGYQYYCEVTDSLGHKINSDPVTMSVETGEITIIKQPEDVIGAYQELYQFSVEAEGVNLKYQWYVSQNGGETWAKSELEGFNTDTMNVRMYPYRDGYMYRCEITSGLKTIITTREATLRLKERTVMLIGSPKDVNCVVDSTVEFHAEATGENLKYQWYVSQDNGANWAKTELEGCKTDTLIVKALKYRSGNKYRCIIADESGTSVVSNAATLITNNPSVKITGQPQNAIANVNEDVQFVVEATGEGLAYQWYVSQDKGKIWSKTGLMGNTTDKLTVTAYAYRDGNMYRCEIVDNSGTKEISDGVTLSVR